MKQNKFLQNISVATRVRCEAIETITKQLCVDVMQVSLHQMGWGEKRINDFIHQFIEDMNHFAPVTASSDEECEIRREELDKCLLEIIRKHPETMVYFAERYPMLKKVEYK